MKKQEGKKQGKLWLWLVIALVVIAAAAAAVILLLPGKAPAAQPVQWDGKLYWNVDRADYVGQGAEQSDANGRLTARSAVGGEYTIRFAVDGEKINYKCDNRDLVVRMDFRDVMGLVFDDRGYIVDMCYPEEVGYTVALNRYVVLEINGNQILTSSNINTEGVEKTIEISENTQIYNLSDADGSGLMVGLPTQLAVLDEIVALQDSEGNVTHVYADHYQQPGDFYWNVERQYDSTLKMSTRQPDNLGYYNYTFAVNGKQVQLRTKDQAVANDIDGYSSQWMGLIFDDEGNIIERTTLGKAVNGGVRSMKYNVQSIEQKDGYSLVHTLGVSTGRYQSTQYIMKDGVPVYDVSGASDYIGQPTELRVGDVSTAIRDCRGTTIAVLVHYRANTWEYYYNVQRQYDATAKQTKRTPDSEGYYYFDMVHDTQRVSVKTNNKAWADYIDAQGTGIVGLVVENGQIVKAPMSATMTMAGYYLASGWGVKSIDDNGRLTLEKLTGEDAGTTVVGMMAQDCKVYNVCPSADKLGEAATLKAGDKVRAYTNYKDEVAMIYVITRGMDSPIYRKIKSLGQKEDGYTYFLMAVNGKQITVRAKDAEVLEKINKSKSLGLYMYGDGTVYKAASAIYTKMGVGGVFADGYTYTGISDGKITAYKDGKTLSAKLAEGYVVYDVSTTGARAGKATTLRYGDKIQGFKNMNGEVTLVYVTGRDAHKGVSHCTCFGAENVDHSKCQKVDYKPIPKVEKNVITITESGNYYLSGDTAATLKIQSGVTVNLCLSGFGLYGRTPISVDEGATLNITDCLGDGYICSTSPTNEGYAIRVFGGTVNLYSGQLLGKQPGFEERVNKVVQVSKGVFNMYGGTIRDGVLNKSNGANLYIIAGTANLYGGTIENGKAVLGNDVYVQKGGTLNLGGTIKAGEVYITNGASFGFLEGFDPEKASATVIVPDMSATFAVGTAKPGYEKAFKSTDPDYSVAYDAATQGLYFELTAADGHIHCLCGGKIQGHNCRNARFATGLTQKMFTDGTVKMGTCTEKEKERPVYVLESGSYYLTEDITLDKEILLKGKGVSVCLNGHKITNTAINVFFLTGSSNLTVADCVGTGVITGSGSATKEGGAIRLTATGDTMNLYGGTVTVTEGTVQTNGGVIACSGTFNLYGGIVTGGTVTGNGGNINLAAVGSVLNMYGGTITGGTAGGQGGNISGRFNAATGKGGTINLYGGVISDGTAAAGDDVYAAGVTTIGAVKAGELYMAATAQVSLNESFDEKVTSVGIDAADAATAQITGLTKDVTANFPSTNSDYASAYADGKLIFKTKQHEHCVCTGSDGADHSQCQNVIWQPAEVKNNAITITQSGHYYLTGTRTQRLDITGATAQEPIVVDLCLNGHIMRANTPIVVGENVTVNICDHTGEGYVTSTNDSNIGCAVRVNGGTVNFYSGTLHGSRQDAGNTHIQNRAVEVLTGQFNMYGGTVTTGVKNGGNGGNVYVEGGSFTMLGGTITGGSAHAGDNVYVSTPGSITLGGTAKICDAGASNLFLAGTKLTVSAEKPFADGAKIGISVPQTAVVAENVTVEDAAHLVQDAGFEFNYTAGTVTVSVPEDPNAHKHCLCGGQTMLGHDYCQPRTFAIGLTQEMFDDGTIPLVSYDNGGRETERQVYKLAEGNGSYSYYLAEDITISNEILVQNYTPTLCLNGFTLENNTTNVFTVTGGYNLYICDHVGTGSLVGTGAVTKEGGVIRIISTAVNVDIYGGTLRTNDNAELTNGGVIANSGTVNLYGGTIVGTKVKNFGGAINMAATGSQFNMYGGTVIGGEAATRGGAISSGHNATTGKGGTINLYGGTVTGGTSPLGSGIYAAHEITIGQAAAGAIYLDGITLGLNAHFDATKASASIQMKTVAADAVVVTGAETDCTGCFTMVGADDYTLTWVENHKNLVLKGGAVTPPVDNKHRHCWCENAAYVPDDHTCVSDQEWLDANELINGDVIKITQGGYYYLSAGVNKSLKLETTDPVYLDLNARRPIVVTDGWDLTLCNCATTGGRVTSSANYKDGTSGRCVIVNGGKFTLVNGTLDASLNNRKTRNVEVTGGEFIMYGGTISNGDVTADAAANGGNLLISGGKASLYGGTVSGGKANEGKDIYVAGGTLAVGAAFEGANYAKAAEGTLTSLVGGMTASHDGSKFVFTHGHCWCYGAEHAPAGHTGDVSCTAQQGTWTAIEKTGNTYTISADGNYYLGWTDGSVAAKKVVVSDGVTACLCLHGNGIRAQNTIVMEGSSNLTICDCSREQTGLIQTTKFAPVKVADGQSITFVGGNITGSYKAANKDKGTASRNSVVINGGEFIMYGGTIKDGCKFTSATSDNATDNAKGGNVQINGGIFTMYAGTITGGGGTTGGDVYVGTNGTFRKADAAEAGDVYLETGKVIEPIA